MAQTVPDNYSLEDIHDDAVKQLQQLQAADRLSSQDLSVLTGTKSGVDVLEFAKRVVADRESDSKIKQKMDKVIGPLIERLKRFEGAIDALIGAVPKPMGADVAGLLWGSLKFVLLVSNPSSPILEMSLMQLLNRWPETLGKH
jgi:hypothetical protein